MAHNRESPRPDIGSYNDAIAHLYDDITREGWHANRVVQPALAHYEMTNPRSVLDVGAGTGQTIEAIKQFANPGRMVAVDASGRMLDRLRSKLPDVETVHATAEDYAARAIERFDLVTAIGSLEFVADLPNVMTALIKATRPNLLIATYIARQENQEAERTFYSNTLGQAFTEYYWPQKAIEAAITEGGLYFNHWNRFEAYQRDEEMVIYNTIVAGSSLPEVYF